jgi:hypothetical protein
LGDIPCLPKNQIDDFQVSDLRLTVSRWRDQGLTCEIALPLA